MKNEYFKNVENIRLSITHACNLKCPYCSDNNSKNNIETIQDIDGVSDFLKTLPKLKLVLLYGGEPLLYKDTVHILKRLLHELPNTRIGIFSNGTTWNDEFAQIMKTNPRAFVNFTRANSKDSQNTWRPYKNGAPSYDIVTDNLRKYSQINPDKISIMNTITQDFIEDLYTGVIDDYNYTPHVYVNMVVSEETFIKHAELEKQMMKLADYALDHKNVVIRNFFKTPNNRPEWFRRNLSLSTQKTYSEFVNGVKNILIDVDGRIYASTSLQGTDHWMGDIYGRINQTELDFYQEVRETGMCCDCEYRYACQPFYEVYNPYDPLTPYKTEAYCKITEVYAKVQDYYFAEAVRRGFDKG